MTVQTKTYEYETFEKSALVIHVPQLEALVAEYRKMYTRDGAMGMPAHITILYPFLTSDGVTSRTSEVLTERLSQLKPFTVHFENFAHFPGVLYLQPSPREPIVQAIRYVAQAFPECPPYSGTIPIDQIVPHLTLAVASSEDELKTREARIREKISPVLPITVDVDAFTLFVKTEGWWQLSESFALRGIG